MAKYKLTADELLLVYLTFIAQTENGDPKINRNYFEADIWHKFAEEVKDKFL